MSGNGGKILGYIFVGAMSWYGGMKFWQPIIIDQLRQDGNLREDVFIPDTSDQPTSWTDLQDKIKDAIHPPDEPLPNTATVDEK
ncbi:hypothetical protein CAAN1_03S01926 [[Candida] anglica]|uniref:Uncharacterized protein n=1 Tax=[Candida] anglica TaxID=148631 RepID=A0ABP0EGP4_9ASCO